MLLHSKVDYSFWLFGTTELIIDEIIVPGPLEPLNPFFVTSS